MMSTQMGSEGVGLPRRYHRVGRVSSMGSIRAERLLNLGTSSSEDNNLDELWEEDVWPGDEDGAGDGDKENEEKSNKKKNFHSNGGILSGLSVAFADPATRSRDLWRSRHRTAAAMIPQMGGGGASEGGLRKALEHQHQHQRHQSAPVNVPDWSKILGIDHAQGKIVNVADDDDDVEEGEGERLPPHEYLAREHARSGHLATTSVFEGVGRTLKGRDMSRVRNAVWSRTGFLD